jgi:hypothetical protein
MPAASGLSVRKSKYPLDKARALVMALLKASDGSLMWLRLVNVNY